MYAGKLGAGDQDLSNGPAGTGAPRGRGTPPQYGLQPGLQPGKNALPLPSCMHMAPTRLVWYRQLDRPVAITLAGMLAFTFAAALRVGPDPTAIGDLVVGTDDWNSYAAYAQDILRNGLLLPVVEGNYTQPAGFLYAYFVAGCLAVSGGSLGFVYMAQAALLGLAMGLSYALFRDLLTGWLRPLLLFGLLLIAVVDVYKYYTFRLLSENLALFLVPLFLLQWKHWWRGKRHAPVTAALCGTTLGLAVLTRPNLAMFAVFMVVVAWWAVVARSRSPVEAGSYSIALLAVALLLALRNYWVTGTASTLPDGRIFQQSPFGWNQYTLLDEPVAFCTYYLKNILFCCGFLNVLEPDYAIRPHWVLMALGTLIYFRHQLQRAGRMGGMDVVLAGFMLTFHVVLIAVAQLANYGFRMLVPGLFITLGVSLKGYELMSTAIRARRIKARQAGRTR